jgi:hypothetical protein
LTRLVLHRAKVILEGLESCTVRGLQVAKGFPGIVFGAVSFPLNKILSSSIVGLVSEDFFDFVFLFSIDGYWLRGRLIAL